MTNYSPPPLVSPSISAAINWRKYSAAGKSLDFRYSFISLVKVNVMRVVSASYRFAIDGCPGFRIRSGLDMSSLYQILDTICNHLIFDIQYVMWYYPYTTDQTANNRKGYLSMFKLIIYN